jgi:hypothetical protein
MNPRTAVGEDARPATRKIRRTSERITSSSLDFVQARRARRLIERWSDRIRTLANDEAEPAWADKAAIFGSKIASLARLFTGGVRARRAGDGRRNNHATAGGPSDDAG